MQPQPTNNGYAPLQSSVVVVEQQVQLRNKRLMTSLVVLVMIFCIIVGVSMASPSTALYWGEFSTYQSTTIEVRLGLTQFQTCVSLTCATSAYPEGSDCYKAGRSARAMGIVAIVFAVFALFALIVLSSKMQNKSAVAVVTVLCVIASSLTLGMAVSWNSKCFKPYADYLGTDFSTFGAMYILVLIGGICGLVNVATTLLVLACRRTQPVTVTTTYLTQPLTA